jgi:hypothetical protein
MFPSGYRFWSSFEQLFTGIEKDVFELLWLEFGLSG